MFGTKKLISQYEARISDLQAEVRYLRSLVSPPTSASRIPVLSLEADAVISGHDEAIDPTADQQQEWDDIQSEANRILSGTY